MLRSVEFAYFEYSNTNEYFEFKVERILKSQWQYTKTIQNNVFDNGSQSIMVRTLHMKVIGFLCNRNK